MKQRQDPSEQFKVSNINTHERRDTSNNERNSQSQIVDSKNQNQARPRSNTPEKSVTYQRDSNNAYQNRAPVTCYNCQQTGHVSRFCRNKKVYPKPDSNQTPSQQKPSTAQKPHNSTKQTRFAKEKKEDAKVNSIKVRINATVGKVSSESDQMARAQVYDPECKEIAIPINVNDAIATAIIDTGSPVTVISKGLFERMSEEFIDQQLTVKSNLKATSIKLFSCEVDKALKTLGECDVMLRHDQFNCISPVIVAVDLAHDCLIGMNVLVLWPTMRNAIEVLLKARLQSANVDPKFESDTQATRLNNICLPRIMSDFDLDRFSMKEPVKAIEYPNESNVNTMTEPQTNIELETSTEQLNDLELAPIIDEQEFKNNYLPEKHLQEIAVNFIAAGKIEVKEELRDIERLDQEFPNVEGMIKGIFPQILAGDNGEVGLALNCVHEINLKPGTKPVKQRVRRVPVNLRAELKKSIDSMLERGIIRHSTSEWASPIVLVRKKTGELRVCIDYRVLNDATIKDAFPIPNIEDLVYQLNLMLIATTFDLAESYNQVLVREEDRPKTAFATDWGLYECNVMSFGLTNAPATFQRMMTMILGSEIGKTCLDYLDDVLNYSSTREQHYKDVYVICFRLAASGLKLKWKKCKVEQRR